MKLHDVPYDYGSIMHYGAAAFSRDWQENTIITKSSAHQRTIGQRDQLSFYDILLMNKEYCQNKCEKIRKIDCQNGGYQHPKFCNRCICPDGLGGTLCDTYEPPKEGSCGGELVATSLWNNVQSPSPATDPNQKCNWLIKAPKGQSVEIEFIDQFQFLCTTSCFDYVEIKNSSDLRDTGMRYCCFDPPKATIKSEDNQMILIFRTTVLNFSKFTARYRAVWNDKYVNDKNGGIGGTSSGGKDGSSVGPPVKDAQDYYAWGEWTGWSGCSQTCGACGTSFRQRSCPYGQCRETNGWVSQYKICGMPACPGNVNCQLLQSWESCFPTHLQICITLKGQKYKCNARKCCPPYNEDTNGYCTLRPDPNAREPQEITI